MRIMGITGVIMCLVELEVYLLSRRAGPKACAGCKRTMGNHFSEYSTVLQKCKIGTLGEGGFAIRGTLRACCW